MAEMMVNSATIDEDNELKRIKLFQITESWKIKLQENTRKKKTQTRIEG